MGVDQEESKPLLSEQKQNHLPQEFPRFRAFVIMGIAAILYSMTSFVVVSVVSQYVVARLWQDRFNSTYNATDKVSYCTVGNSSKIAENLAQEQETQKEAASLTLYYSLLTYGIGIFSSVFVGPLTDSVGRKTVLLIPVCGILVKNIFVTFIVYFELSMNYFYPAYAIDGLCGSFSAVFLASFSYTADVTVPGKPRTLAMAVLELSMAAAVAIGQIANGYFIKYAGFFYPMVTIVSIGFLDIAIIFFLLPETLMVKTKPDISPLTNLKKVFGFYFSKDNAGKRIPYLVGLCMFFFATVTKLGRLDLETIYQLGEPFCWSPVKIGWYDFIQFMVHMICGVSGLKILQRCLREDAVIGMISCLSLAAGYLLEGFANTDELMYLVPVASLLGGIPVPIVRAILSKMTLPNKQGALFASIAIVEGLCYSTSSILYNAIYTATVQYYRGIVWFVMAGLMFIDILFFSWFMCIPSTKKGLNLDCHVAVSPPSINNDSESGMTHEQPRRTLELLNKV